jgi:mono/diheme cytochrome c family protein
MKKGIAVLTLAALGLAPAAAADDAAQSRIARGKYLVETSGCADCHTPHKLGPNGPEPDETMAYAGHPEAMALPPAPKLPPGPWLFTGTGTMTAWSGPWGTSYTANLTPDKETGIGAWTEENFVQALRTGRHMGKGRPILPPMPLLPLRKATDDHLKDMYAYFMSLKPIRNKVPAPLPPAE